MRTMDEDPVCLFMEEEKGYTVYEHRQVLFGEQSISLINNAAEDRMTERKDIFEARQAAEVAHHKANDPIDKFIDG